LEQYCDAIEHKENPEANAWGFSIPLIKTAPSDITSNVRRTIVVVYHPLIILF
jgi:hypothetical protein